MSWDLSPKCWFKINFDGSMQCNKAGACFVVRNDIRGLVGAYSIPLMCSTVSYQMLKFRDYGKLLYGQWKKFRKIELC